MKFASELRKTAPGILENKSFVLTGTLKNFSREEAKEAIIKFGGKVSSGVSSKTDYVIAGENPGSKLSKAKEFQIQILTEDEFSKLISS